jgi:hypothetical protein
LRALPVIADPVIFPRNTRKTGARAVRIILIDSLLSGGAGNAPFALFSIKTIDEVLGDQPVFLGRNPTVFFQLSFSDRHTEFASFLRGCNADQAFCLFGFRLSAAISSSSLRISCAFFIKSNALEVKAAMATIAPIDTDERTSIFKNLAKPKPIAPNRIEYRNCSKWLAIGFSALFIVCAVGIFSLRAAAANTGAAEGWARHSYNDSSE